MSGYYSRFSRFTWLALVGGILAALPLRETVATWSSRSGESAPVHWQSPARLHHGLRATPGTLIIDANGVEFRSEQRLSHRWPFIEIESFDLAPHRLVLTDYENRGRHRPGDRKFRFDLKTNMPPGVAAELARRVGKPVRNGDPDPSAPSYATIPARHRTHTGGTNGTLRFREEGIDYVTTTNRGGRSWRWSDIQTLANPHPYHLRVGGYRETFDFELKQPLPPELFERLWDKVYARNLSVSPTGGKP